MQDKTMLLLIVAAQGVVAIPLILKLVPPNSFYGFRTAETLANPVIWYRVNALGGWGLLIAAILTATVILMLPQMPALLATVLFAGLGLGSVVLSCVYLRRIAKPRAGADR